MATQEKTDVAEENKLGLPSQGQTEQLYYQAMQDAKLDDQPKETGQKLGPLGYSREDFIQWARKIDIYTLDKGAADFSTEKHEQIVDEFGAYRKNVVSNLAKKLTYENLPLPGRLSDIGSCIDGSKVGSANEMDSLYIMDGNNYIIEKSDKRGLYRVYVEIDSTRHEIQPRRLREQLAKKYSELISRLKLPDCLANAGYRSSVEHSHDPQLLNSGYSGVRYNGPAVTSQFLTKDKTLITWDITPVVVLRDGEIQARVRKSKSMQAIIADNTEKMFPPNDIHLFPDATTNIWRLTTAAMEADVLCRMSSHAAFKEAFSSCKVLSTNLKGWRDKNIKFDDVTLLVDIVGALTRYNAMDGSAEKTEEGEVLNRMMRFAHIWISADKRDEYNEDKKSAVSVNNAAVKHALLRAASDTKGAFVPPKNPALVTKLIRTAFEELGDDKSYSTEHAFLPEMRISHFSVAAGMASQKHNLARDIIQQCKTLVYEAMTEPHPPDKMNTDDFLHELNACAVPSKELTCGEYCFHQFMNPFQHPCFDQNIHHLTTLLTALSSTCGGVVYLNSREQIVLNEVQFSSFRLRLLALLDVFENLLEIFQDGNGRSWATMVVRKSQEALQCYFNYSCMKLCIGIHGQLEHNECTTDSEGLETSKIPRKNAPDSASKETIGDDGSPPSKIPKLRTDSKDETIQPAVDFSALHELNWDKNKCNWQEILKEANISADECINKCDIWNPRLPMQITPDRNSLSCLFLSDFECRETICKLETKTPGFAIVSRSWTSFLPDLGILQRPPNHLCDFLTIATGGVLLQPKICLWVVVSASNEHIIQRQIEYMFIVGRTIKHQLSNQTRDIPNLAIRCMLHSTHLEDNAKIENKLQELGTQNVQDFLCSELNETNTFEAVRRCIALLLLSQTSPVKTCAGNQMSVKFSAKQAQTLLEIKSRKVSYVSCPPGTGKTLCGLALYREFGKDHSVYLCPTEPLSRYLRHNGCEAKLVRDDEELDSQIKDGTFKNKTCVIIDESHRLRCSKAGLGKLFNIVKRGQMRLIVFADNSYQSFDRENQENIETYIHDFSKKILGYYPHTPIFTEIYRNTRKVVSFLQHAVGDLQSDNLDITCANANEGDGIHCVAMDNILDTNSDNGLVQYLRPLLHTRYLVTEVAVLLDSGYTDNDIGVICQILKRHLPSVTPQSAVEFPREGIIIDRVERFAGLDAALCIFLLSFRKAANREATIANPRYRVYLASRATQKAVFVVPRIDADVVQHMKFDDFHPPLDFQKVTLTRRHQTQRSDRLCGLCYDDNKLYCVECRQEEDTADMYWLTMYDIRHPGDGGFRLIDSVEVEGAEWDCTPRVDLSSRRVYVPCRRSGVRIFCCEDDRLSARATLKCVGMACGVSVNTTDTVYVGVAKESVYLVNVSTDSVIRQLDKPEHLRDYTPYHVSVLGQTVLVCYGYKTLVTYSSDGHGKVLQRPDGLSKVHSITTDGHSSFLVVDAPGSVFVLDREGTLCHRIEPDTDTASGALRDCALVQSQLWLGYWKGTIDVMSSR